MPLRPDGRWFRDEHGRAVILRGVNLDGGSKLPVQPRGESHLRESLSSPSEATFVGRPFPLEHAAEHFARLRHWGMSCVRYLVTWEAIEHRGPGQHDEAYLDATAAIIELAGTYGLQVIVDPHQDVWSRFSGGCGAPAWTLESVGFAIENLHASGAAYLHAHQSGPVLHMGWAANSTRLACATMFALFFGGNRFAPDLEIEGERAQEFLQRHYVSALQSLARRLSGMRHVIGYEVMNEPLPGFIGHNSIAHTMPGMIRMGDTPTPLQSMALGEGISQEVEVWGLRPLGLGVVGRRVLNAQGTRAWREGVECVWKRAGVWKSGSDGAVLALRAGHFANGDFSADFMRPFVNRLASSLRAVHAESTVFVEFPPRCDAPRWTSGDARGIAFAPHWYDGAPMMLKRFHRWLGVDFEIERPVLTPWAIERSYRRQLGRFLTRARDALGGVPTILGEFGIPHDLSPREDRVPALDRTYRALDANMLHGTVWNYTVSNTASHGDGFNGEDFSVFNNEHGTSLADLDSGGRALDAVVRPYPRAVAGEPLRFRFDLATGCFEFEFVPDRGSSADTELFVPTRHYPNGFTVHAADGVWTHDKPAQILRYRPISDRRVHAIRITPCDNESPSADTRA